MASPITQNVAVAAAKAVQPPPQPQRELPNSVAQTAISQASQSEAKRATDGKKPRERTAPRIERQVEGQFGVQAINDHRHQARAENQQNERESSPSSDSKLDVVA